MLVKKWHLNLALGATLAAAVVPTAVSANLMQSSHFRLDPNVANNFGGNTGSSSYKLTDSGGEAVVGAGSSGSYRLTQGYVAQLAQSLQLSVMPADTFAYWPLDTGTGTSAYDVSITGDLGTLQSAPTWTTGKLGKALAFNGTNQYVSTATTQTSPNTLTLETWFRSSSTTGGLLMGLGSAQTGASATADRLLYLTNGGQLVFGAAPGGTKKTISSPSSYADGNWHHVAGTLGTGGMVLYVDGNRVATDGTTISGGSYTGYWRLGYDSLTGWPSAPTSNFLSGTIDESRVITRQLTDTEVKGDYAAGNLGQQFAHTLPNLTPGTSQTYSSDAVVRTDAGGYNLLLQATGLLKHSDNVTTIPMMSGTVATPTAWTEGTTKGLGFTVSAATQLEAKWGGSPFLYAGVPTAATTFHARTGLTGGAPEKTTVQFRADTAPQQKQGTYQTTVVYTATMKP